LEAVRRRWRVVLNSSVFETFFGLTFIFYAVAVICSGAVEAWANLMQKRSKYLLRGLRDLLDGTSADPLPDAGGPVRNRAGWVECSRPSRWRS
jgi:hypothetical protein